MIYNKQIISSRLQKVNYITMNIHWICSYSLLCCHLSYRICHSLVPIQTPMNLICSAVLTHICERVSDCCLSSVQQVPVSKMFQLRYHGEQLRYHGENMLHLDLCFVIDNNVLLDFNSASSQRQQFICRHITPQRHIRAVKISFLSVRQ